MLICISGLFIPQPKVTSIEIALKVEQVDQIWKKFAAFLNTRHMLDVYGAWEVFLFDFLMCKVKPIKHQTKVHIVRPESRENFKVKTNLI